MTAIRNSPEFTPQRVAHMLADWFAARHPSTVEFREEVAPKNYPNEDDYSVVYEAVFEPKLVDQARIEISLTDEGNVAVGFEKRERVAQRLGLKVRGDRFAAGHEPHRMTEPGLLLLLNMVADGEIAIVARVLPLLGLMSTKAVVADEKLEALISKGYAPLGWLNGISRAEFSNKGDLLKYRRW